MNEPLVSLEVRSILNTNAIDGLHTDTLARRNWPDEVLDAPADPFLAEVLNNHRQNSLLWKEEDLARRTDVEAEAIAANKRAIDRYNQRRNDAIEKLDDMILSVMTSAGHSADEPAWINSETAGSIIDRMSIGSLKIHHMALQCHREDADEEHRKACAVKLLNLQAQRAHLRACLDRLLTGMLHGQCTYRIHRQFKMYNDPKLNPYLYASNALVPGETW
jgi:hypothetical protein